METVTQIYHYWISLVSGIATEDQASLESKKKERKTACLSRCFCVVFAKKEERRRKKKKKKKEERKKKKEKRKEKEKERKKKKKKVTALQPPIPP